MLLKLFKPWRKEEDICFDGKSKHETYCIESDNYPTMVEYHERSVAKVRKEEEFERKVRERAKELEEKEKEAVLEENIDDP